MKKIFIGVMLVALMFVCAPTPASAVTIAELQAMIASLTAQLNVLLAQQNSSNLTLNASVDSYNEVNLKAAFDPNKIDPISVSLRSVCPVGVSLSFGVSGNICNSDLNMDFAGQGTYKSILKFTNTSGVDQRVDFKAFTNGNIYSTNYALTSVIIPGNTNPTATSTGYVSFVERPTFKLGYDKNKGESSLEAVANVYVDAGANDLLMNYMAIFIGDANGRQVFTNKRTAEFVGVSNTTKELVPTTYGASNEAWRVKAGTRAAFKIMLIESPQAMFAGTYTASLGSVGILNKAGEAVYDQLGYENTKSFPVTIIGEKSPYITSNEFKNGNVVLYGERFSNGSKIYVNGTKKGVLMVSKQNGGSYIGTFPDSWLDKSDKGGCALYGSIQIEDPKYGKSNGVYISRGCDDKGSNFPEIIARSISSDSQVIKAVENSNISDKVIFTYRATLTAKNGDVYIPDGVSWVGPNMNRNFDFGANLALEKNGVVVALDQYSPRINYEFSNARMVGKHWLIKNGDTSNVNVTVEISNVKGSGAYRASLVGFTYNDNPANVKYKTHSINPGRFATEQVSLRGLDNGLIPSISVCPVLTKNLTVGSSGTEVTALQNFLIAKGYLISTTAVSTGYFGMGTRDALVRYQTAKGISPADGYLGAMTREVIKLDCGGTTPGRLSAKSMELIGVSIGSNTFQAGKPIKFSVKGISSDGKQAYPSSGFHVQSAIKQPSQTTKWEPVTVNGVVQSVNAEFNYYTGYWEVTMTAPSDPSVTYTVDTAFYCSMSSSGCVDGSQINQSFNFTIGNPINITPSITITSPNGGGYYPKNSQMKVTWTTNIPQTEYLDVIRLREYPNGQEYYLAGGVLNTGGTNVTIPSNVPAGGYTLEIKTYTKGSGILVMDASDSYFKITDSVVTSPTQPSITVLYPNGRETLGAGKTILAKWTSSNLGSLSLNIDLINREGSYVRLASAIANTGSYQGQLPTDLKDGYYKLLVSTNDKGPSVLDYSDEYFMTINGPSIIQPSITVLSPNGGEVLNVGSSAQINWASKGNIGQKIRLILDYVTPNIGGGYFIATDILDTGSYTWKVPNDWLGSAEQIRDYGKYYRIHACVLDNNSNIISCDYSDSTFTINPLTVLPVVLPATTTSPSTIPATAPNTTTPTISPNTTTPTATKICYVGSLVSGGIRWEVKSCTSSDYLRAPANLKKEVVATTQAEQLKSIANVLQAIKEMLKGL